MDSSNRSSGILMPVSSLPSEHGIGCFSKEAYEFVDFLKNSKVRYWQILPLGVTSYGDSPYQSPSSKGINYYFIDLDTLVKKHLLTKDDIIDSDFYTSPQYVDYGRLFSNRISLLKKAFSNFDKKDKEFVQFERAGMYRDFAFYMTLKELNGYKPWYEWPNEIKKYKFSLEERTLTLHKDLYLFYVWTQFEVLHEYLALKSYANQNGIEIIGDMPLYLARDSVEAYKYPEMFLFDRNQDPTLVAGCPPDPFSSDGQLWGNPIYNWEFMKKTGYSWFNDRIRYSLQIFDVLRIDHFRGLAGYYVIPFGLKTARVGQWRTGPGFDLFYDKKDLPIIAEDLGFIDQPVRDLLNQTGYPGMKILEFAFDGNPDNDHKPTNTTENYVCYTGTHDNEPIYGYLLHLSEGELDAYKSDVKLQCHEFDIPYIDDDLKDLAETTVRLCYAGKTNLAIVPFSDILLKDDAARMNTPSTLGGNWTYRFLKKDFSKSVSNRIIKYVTESNRG